MFYFRIPQLRHRKQEMGIWQPEKGRATAEPELSPSAGVRGALGTRRSRPSHVGPTLLTDADLLDEQDPLEESAV